ncbi:hypothetical protein LTS14_002210 [Recurvomyces mirabilis]|uniref:uncharacterized protein n=1 Tax=Recurvomyces mirabilis TaxID=574656 RepID=UPI002DDDEEC4|nr:hypothetical protein LTS14_002210 [Recurvomyces mirabilis]
MGDSLVNDTLAILPAARNPAPPDSIFAHHFRIAEHTPPSLWSRNSMDNSYQPYAGLDSSSLPQILQAELHPPAPQSDDGSNGKRKADDGQPQQRAKRNRYISIACNECKRRKIKCNGQNPCQRCGNLSLECVYAPNCCNGFKDTQEYREMAGQIESLQEQVNMLYHDLSHLRTQLGQGPPPPMQHPPPPPAPVAQPAPPHQQHQQQQQQYNAAIDPSLQSYYQPPRSAFQGQKASPGAPIANMSPGANRHRSQSQSQQPSFRGPTSAEFNFDVAKSSLQTMGISGVEEGSGDATGDANPTPSGSPPRQVLDHWNADKDPIWKTTQEEAMRLCQVYEDEMGLMYPVLDIQKVMAYATKLYRFMEAAHRTGLMQQGFPGGDAIEDEDTNILKMVMAVAMTVEASGRSDLGRRLFEYVQPAIDNLLLGNVGVKGIRLLVMTAMYEFHRDNEGTSWRIIGLTARLCIELGLHRRETYEIMTDEGERQETLLLFWAIFVLDRRWSFGTGMPFALQDADIDPLLPKPEESSPYLTAMIQYCTIGSKVWRTVATTPSPSSGQTINTEEMNYLDYQVIQWHRQIPPQLRFEHPAQSGRLSTPIGPAPSRAGNRLRILLYLRANQMRILIYRPVLHSATSIIQHREQAQTVIDVAKDTIRVLTHINQTSDLYRTQQVLFNAFLTSALAVLFLAVSHTPAVFADNVREEFYMALDLVRGFSKGSWIGKRLWKTIRVLKEVGPKLGLPITDASIPGAPQHGTKEEELDPSRSAAVAMAGLAGHNVDEAALFNGLSQPWSGTSVSPDNMANELTSLFEAAGGLQQLGESGVQVSEGGYVPVSGVENMSGQFGQGEGTLAPHAEAARIHDDELREAFLDPGGDGGGDANRHDSTHNPEQPSVRNRANSLSAAFAKACTLDEEVALSEMSSSSQAPESWISAFCSLVGHEYFAEVSEDFIEDDFNLTGLQSQVSMYKEALEMILDVEPEDASEEEDEEEDDDDEDDDDMQNDAEGRSYRRAADAAERRHLRMASDLSVIESSAEMLYGLIHQRFITSRPGIQQMAEKYELGHFGHCPRVYCSGAKVLPVGLSDIPGQETVKLFCPSCLDVYSPPNSRFQTVDGAFFGTTFGCLFFMTFPELEVGGPKSTLGPLREDANPVANKDSRSSLSSSLTSQAQAPPTATSSSATLAAIAQQPESINGVAPKNLAPGLGPGSIYEPRIYGFRVSEIAKTGPRMKWLRSRPVDVNELDECRLWTEGQQQALEANPNNTQKEAATAANLGDSEMADENVEEDGGEVEDEDMGVNGEGDPPDGVAQNGQPAHLPDVAASRKASRRRNHDKLTNGEGGGTALSVGGPG